MARTGEARHARSTRGDLEAPAPVNAFLAACLTVGTSFLAAFRTVGKRTRALDSVTYLDMPTRKNSFAAASHVGVGVRTRKPSAQCQEHTQLPCAHCGLIENCRHVTLPEGI